jgi:hypothetical protein
VERITENDVMKFILPFFLCAPVVGILSFEPVAKPEAP